MNIAYFALLVALVIGIGIAVSSLIFPGALDTSSLIQVREDQIAPATGSSQTTPSEGEDRVATPETIIEVPVGEFKGPTGQPTVIGPSGPPPSQ